MDAVLRPVAHQPAGTSAADERGHRGTDPASPLAGTARRSDAPGTQSADAYDLYLRGWNFANQRTPATSRRAIEYFERATAIEPNYALAWTGITHTLASGPINGDAQPAAVTSRAREAALRAVRADPELAQAQFALAYVEWMLDWDWPAAERRMRTTIVLDPGTPERTSCSDTFSRRAAGTPRRERCVRARRR